jgi:hypothetical protein
MEHGAVKFDGTMDRQAGPHIGMANAGTRETGECESAFTIFFGLEVDKTARVDSCEPVLELRADLGGKEQVNPNSGSPVPEHERDIKTKHTSSAAGKLAGMARSSLEKAIRIGELLTEQKARLKHGEWLPWIERNLEFDQKTAWRYTHLFTNRGKLGTMPNLGITEAYRLLSQPAGGSHTNPVNAGGSVDLIISSRLAKLSVAY